MKTMVVGVLFLGVACGPVVAEAPPPHDGARFELLTASPVLGHVFFDIDDAQQLVGRVEFDGASPTPHQLRVGVRWSPRINDAEGVTQTLTPVLFGPTGTVSFSVPPLQPPHTVRLPTPNRCDGAETAAGQLIVFVDENQNGVLDPFDTDSPDRVLAASTFPHELFGARPVSAPPLLGFERDCAGLGWFSAQGARLEFPLFDDRRLDLVACNDPARLTATAPCGIVRVQRPVIAFDAQTEGETATLGFYDRAEQGQHEVYVDDQLRGAFEGNTFITVNTNELLTGEHRVRVEAPGLLPWEATLTLPQPLVVLERPRVLQAGKTYPFVVSSQGGVTQYSLSSYSGPGSLISAEPRLEYQQPALAENQTDVELVLRARFGDLPVTSMTQLKIPAVP